MTVNQNEVVLNTMDLFQNWLFGKKPMPIGTKFIIKDQNRVITLVEKEGYLKGRFIFDNGEYFDISKNPYCKFIKVSDMEREKEQDKKTIYDEDYWDFMDTQVNGNVKIKNENTPIILKTLWDTQENEGFRDVTYFDVTSIIRDILKNYDKKYNDLSNDYIKKIYGYLLQNDFPIFAKDKLYDLFNGCDFNKTSHPDILEIVKNNKDVGFLITLDGKYIFLPKEKKFSDEYSFTDDKSAGFFCTAESYLDIALSTIDNYKEHFVLAYRTNESKNKESFGYQADATIKTLLAFSCECYLKSLLIKDGKDLNDIKKMGHGLAVLYTSLKDEYIGNIFKYMEQSGYNINMSSIQPVYETNDLTEKFMLDLARVDVAFIDSRYSAENDKNTDYDFLYKFALALRRCAKLEQYVNSPFNSSIQSKIGNKK